MDVVKIGFVGVGGMGQAAHLRNYVEIPECQVVAVSELRQDMAKAVAVRYGIPRVYPNAEEMLANEKLDGIVASQPFHRHGEVVAPLFKAGVPVFTEKPLAASIEVGERIIEAAAKAGTWHMVGYHKRSDPATMYAKAEIERLKETKELGALRYVRILMPAGDWVQSGFWGMVGSSEQVPPLECDPPAEDMDAKTFEQYIAFVNYYIHQVNLMRHLLGESYQVTYADPSGVVLVVQSCSGVAGIIEMSPYQTTVDWQESALVAFERGIVELSLPAPLAFNRPGSVKLFRDPGAGAEPETRIPQLPWIHAMRQQAVNFVKAIKGEMAPLCTSQEALEDLKVAREYIRLLKGC